MNKFFKNFTLILLLIFSSKTIFCMQEQTTCKSEHTYPNLNIDGLPQEVLINIVVQLLEKGVTVEDGLDNVKNFFLTNKSINNELKEYFWNNITKELLKINDIIINNVIVIEPSETFSNSTCSSIQGIIINLKQASKNSDSLLFKIFANTLIPEFLCFNNLGPADYKYGYEIDRVATEDNFLNFIFYYRGPFLLDSFLGVLKLMYNLDEEKAKSVTKQKSFSDFLSSKLTIALKFRNKSAVKLLVNKYKTEINSEHIFYSIDKFKDFEIFKLLFEHSVFSQNVDEFKKLLAPKTFVNRYPKTTILLYALECNLDIFNLLIKHIRSLDIDITEKQGLVNPKVAPSLMQIAIIHEFEDEIQTILDNRDLIIFKQEDLLLAIKIKDKDIVNLLLTNEFFQAEYDHIFFLDYCETDAKAKALHALAEEQRLLAEERQSKYLDCLNADPKEKTSYFDQRTPDDAKITSLFE